MKLHFKHGLLVLVIMCFVLAGCGEKGNSNPQSSKPATGGKSVEVSKKTNPGTAEKPEIKDSKLNVKIFSKGKTEVYLDEALVKSIDIKPGEMDSFSLTLKPGTYSLKVINTEIKNKFEKKIMLLNGNDLDLEVPLAEKMASSQRYAKKPARRKTKSSFFIRGVLAANEGAATANLKICNGMIAVYKKKGYGGIGLVYPVGNDAAVTNSGKYCALYYEVNNAEERVTLIGRADAAADCRANGDAKAVAGAKGIYKPSKHITEHIFLEPVTFEMNPKQGYWFGLMKKMGGKNGYDFDLKNSRNHYAIVAYPDKYGESGIHTFIINEEGTVYSKDLGKGEYLDTYPAPDPTAHGWLIAN